MRDKNNDIAIDRFKDSINESIDYIIDIAYKAGKIDGVKTKIESPKCDGCIHYSDEDQSEICFECDRMIRSDLYEGIYDVTSIG